MPGHTAHKEVPAKRNLVIRPIQANLTIDDNLIGKMDAYCKFKCGHHKAKSEVCKDAGKYPFWNTVLTLATKDELYAECHVKNKKLGGLYGRTIATCKIPLREVGPVIGSEGHITQWFEVHQNMKPVGRILLDISYDTVDQVPLKNTSIDPHIPHGQLPSNTSADPNAQHFMK